MKNILFLPALLIFLSAATAQDISGSWSGQLGTPAGDLTIVLHIKDSTGIYSAVMDSPDQNAMGIPVSKITFDDDSLHLEVAGGAIVYDGVMAADSIKGTFQQSGMSLPLTLRKGDVEEKVLRRPQHPEPPFPYRSEEVTFVNAKADGIRLAGTLTLPQGTGRFPAAILISGSGPQDRDETIMGHKPFLVIADYLTRRGIAVLRFDDRGTAASEGDFNTATTADFATDVAAAVAFLKQRKDIDTDEIGLIGHSEGGIIASMVAAGDESIAFIVLLAAPGLDGKKILMMQTALIAEASGVPADQIRKTSEANRQIYNLLSQEHRGASFRDTLVRKIASLMPASTPMEQRMKMAESQADALMTPWFRYFLKNDPAPYLRKVKVPVLAIGGGKDLQVPANENIKAIAKALEEGGNTHVTTKIFPDLNHLFQHADTGLMNEYGKIEETFAPEALDYMGDWVLER